MKKSISIFLALVSVLVLSFAGIQTVFADDGDVTTAYGTIPAAYADATTYPFVVFKADETFVGAYNLWGTSDKSGAFAKVDAMGTDGVVILMRADYKGENATEGRYPNFGFTNYSATVDLGGHEFAPRWQSGPMFGYKTRGTSVSTKVDITVKNGTINYGRKAVVDIADVKDEVCSATVSFTFENVTFKHNPSGNSQVHKIVNYNAMRGSETIQTNIIYKNCTFDITSSIDEESLFEAGTTDGSVKTTMNVTGGTIKASNAIKNTWTKVNNANSSVTFAEGTNGLTTLTVPTGASVPAEPIAISSKNYVFGSPTTSGDNDTYSLIKAGDYAVYLTKAAAHAFEVKSACTMYVAAYGDGDVLLAVKSVPLTEAKSESLSDWVPTGTKTLKAFLWSEGLSPLCVGQTVDF